MYPQALAAHPFQRVGWASSSCEIAERVWPPQFFCSTGSSSLFPWPQGHDGASKQNFPICLQLHSGLVDKRESGQSGLVSAQGCLCLDTDLVCSFRNQTLQEDATFVLHNLLTVHLGQGLTFIFRRQVAMHEMRLLWAQGQHGVCRYIVACFDRVPLHCFDIAPPRRFSI